MKPEREKVLRLFAQLSEIYPEMRFGQLVTNVSQWAKGPVDADWMFRTYAYGIGGLFPHAPTPIFYFSKVVLRNLPATIAGEGGLFSELDDPSYTNAPKAMWYLIVRHPSDFDIGGTLKNLFEPALKACECKGR